MEKWNLKGREAVGAVCSILLILTWLSGRTGFVPFPEVDDSKIPEFMGQMMVTIFLYIMAADFAYAMVKKYRGKSPKV